MDERAHTQALELTFTTTLKTAFFPKNPNNYSPSTLVLDKIIRGYFTDNGISY